jgi:ribose transport system permease protein
MVIITAGIDLSVGSVLALGGCLAAVAMSYWGWPFVSGALLGVFFATLAGLASGAIIAKGRIPDFIATLGMLGAIRGIALLITGGLPVPSHFTATKLAGYLPQSIVWLGSGDIKGIPVPMVFALFVVAITWFILNRTTFGRSLYAVGGNREAARAAGINVDRIKILVYGVSGLYCGLAGLVLVGRMNSANALMAEGLELQTIAAVVIGGTNLFGGKGSVFGTLIGAILMGVLSNGLNLLNVEPFWQRVVNGLLIVAVVVFDQWRRRVTRD